MIKKPMRPTSCQAPQIISQYAARTVSKNQGIPSAFFGPLVIHGILGALSQSTRGGHACFALIKRGPTVAKNHIFKPERSEEHTSELQSRGHLVCRLLLEKKKKTQT